MANMGESMEMHSDGEEVIATEIASAVVTSPATTTMKGRKSSFAKLRRIDSLQIEAGKVSFSSIHANHLEREKKRDEWEEMESNREIDIDTDIEPVAVSSSTITTTTLKGRKGTWMKLRRVDSLLLEAGNVFVPSAHNNNLEGGWSRTLNLAFQCLGVIYGDIGTSPLYVYSSTFQEGIHHKDDILGVLSLIIYTLILIPFIKYVFIVLDANDNGDGGTFALYSLLCRHTKVSLIPNDQPEDKELSNYRLEIPSMKSKRAEKLKNKLENNNAAKVVIFLVTILGTSMVIGNGILTPPISVLSAVGGIKNRAESLNQDAVVGISIAILVILFLVQRFGTDKVGYSFAPIIVLWFSFIGGIGIYNFFKHDVKVLRAFNPKYIIDYFKRNGKQGWISLGGVVLAITGAEAMFADIGHFNVAAVQISFSAIVLPAVLSAYIGQAAYLTKFPSDVSDTFYKSIPDTIFWPVFVVAIAAAIIASQAMITGSFAIISQSLNLGCFPRVKVVHTSAKYEGQVYIPEINYMLMIACVLVTFGFKSTDKIGNAYGICVIATMLITTFMLTLIMRIVWKTSMWWITLFGVVFGSIEIVCLSSVLYKFKDGGYLPLAFSLVLMIIMAIWHYAHKQRYLFELNNKVSSNYVRDLVSNPDINRIPGIGLLYSELVEGIPPIFSHFIENLQSIHSVFVLVSIKFIPISKVALEERFLFRQVEPRDYRMFRCVVRYGYKDVLEEPKDFERELVEYLELFMRNEQFIHEAGENVANTDQHVKVTSSSSAVVPNEEPAIQSITPSQVSSFNSIGSFRAPRSENSSSRMIPIPIQGIEEEIQFLQKAKEKGVVYFLGEAEVVAKQDSSPFHKFVVNNAYSFLRKNFRQGEKLMQIPHGRLLRVGMTYEI